jgi:endonuclease YncB( thermonuclease family)
MRRARRVLVTLVVAAVAIGAVATAVAVARPASRPVPSAVATSAPDPSTSGRPGGATPVPTSAPARPVGAFPMTVRYVYDGDTLQLQHASPNAVVTTTNPIRVRLIGVDTPETKPTPECWAGEATARLRALTPVGATVWVAPDRDSWDDYGRRLFSVWTADGTFVEGALVSSGAARAIRVWPNVANHPYLAALEERAVAARVGRWGACG